MTSPKLATPSFNGLLTYATTNSSNIINNNNINHIDNSKDVIDDILVENHHTSIKPTPSVIPTQYDTTILTHSPNKQPLSSSPKQQQQSYKTLIINTDEETNYNKQNHSLASSIESETETALSGEHNDYNENKIKKIQFSIKSQQQTQSEQQQQSSNSIKKNTFELSNDQQQQQQQQIYKIHNLKSTNDDTSLKEQLNLYKYELKEKDLDIIQLQKEINELQLENKLLKAKMPIQLSEQHSNAYDALLSSPTSSSNENKYIREILALKKEKECLNEELQKAQDTIGRLKLEKSIKSIDIYEPNSPEILQKKIKAYEKQVQELEDENEKCQGELSNISKQLEKLKQENSELNKTKVNDVRKVKEQEETFLIEISNLKNEINNLKYINEQLIDENKRLISLNQHRSASVASLNESIKEDDNYRIQEANQQHYRGDLFGDDARNYRKDPSIVRHGTNTQYQNEQQNTSKSSYKILCQPLSASTTLVNNSSTPHSANNSNHHNRDISPARSENSDSTIYLTTYKTSSTPNANNNNNNNNNNANYYYYENDAHSHQHHHQHHTQQQQPQQQQHQHVHHSHNYTSKSVNPLGQSTQSTLKQMAFLQQQQQQQTPQHQQQQHHQHQHPVSAQSYKAYNKPSLIHNDEYLISNFKPFNSQQQQQQLQVGRSSSYLSKGTKSTPVSASNQYLANSNPKTFLTTASWRLSNNYEQSNDQQTKYNTLLNNDFSPVKSNQRRRKASTASTTSLTSLTSTGSSSHRTTSSFNNDKGKQKTRRSNTFSNEYENYNKNQVKLHDNSPEHYYQQERYEKPRQKSASKRPVDQHRGVYNYAENELTSSSLKINVMKDIKSAQKLKKNIKDSTALQYSTTLPRGYRVASAGMLAPSTISMSNGAINTYKIKDKISYDNEYEKGNLFTQLRSKSVDRLTIEKDSLNRDVAGNALIREIMAKKRPFVPQKANDIQIGDVIKFSRPGGKISRGIVKYIGPLPDRTDTYLGLELDVEEGKHDGIYQSKRYFQAKQNKGVFVSFSKVVMAWGDNH